MTELALIALGIYLISKVRSSRVLPPLDTALPDLPPGRRDLVCPWFWSDRPGIFNVVPLGPGSRSRWLTMCDLWRQVAKDELKIDELKSGIGKQKGTKQQKANAVKVIEDQIKQLRNAQAFNMKEAKRIAKIQRKLEAKYFTMLKNQFSDQEINAFYEQRKTEIINRIWPKTDTQIVPIVSPGNSTALDPGTKITFDPGMGNKYDRDQMNKKPDLYKRPWWEADKKRIAAPPGKRVSSTGNIYYEYRINRSDEPGRNI